MDSCYIIDDLKNLYSYGGNRFGQLALGDDIPRNNLTLVPSNTKFLQVAYNGSFMVALSVGGYLYTCGINDQGQLGQGDRENSDVLLPIPSNTQFVQIAVGYSHLVALDQNGDLYSCGDNSEGQLGQGNIKGTTTLTRIESDTKFKYIACCDDHTVAIDIHGQLYGCGRNYGYLLTAYVTTARRGANVLMPINTPSRFVQVESSSRHTIGLTRYGDLYGCGSNDYGQLGLEYNNSDKVPQFMLIPSEVRFIQIACGMNHTIALTRDGDLYGCGRNHYSQLGLGNPNEIGKLVPELTRIPSDTRFLQVSCIGDYTMALSEHHELYECGLTGESYIIDDDNGNVRYGKHIYYVHRLSRFDDNHQAHISKLMNTKLVITDEYRNSRRPMPKSARSSAR